MYKIIANALIKTKFRKFKRATPNWNNYHLYQIKFTKDQHCMIFTAEIVKGVLLLHVLILISLYSPVKQVLIMNIRMGGTMKMYSVIQENDRMGT